jgi:hypothetical protein
LAALYLLHLGFLLCLGVGQFPWLNFTALIVFIPGAAWDWIGRRFSSLSEPIALAIQRPLTRCAGSFQKTRPALCWAGWSPPRELLALFCLGGMLYANLNSVWPNGYPLSESIRDGSRRAGLAQNWVMFATAPPVRSWFLVETLDRRGNTGYLLNARIPWESNASPGNVNESYGNYRWRKLFSNLWYNRNDSVRRGLLAYVCRRHPEFSRLSLIYVVEKFKTGDPPRHHPLIVNYACVAQ